LVYFFKKVRSFNTVSKRSVDQRASKSLAERFGGLKKKSAAWTLPPLKFARGQIILSLMAINFAALQSRDLKFLATKDLSLFKSLQKVQEASSILRVGFSSQSDLIYIVLTVSALFEPKGSIFQNGFLTSDCRIKKA